MSFRTGIAAAVVAATGVVWTVQTAAAEESGTFTALSSMTYVSRAECAWQR